jgi:hypothetical protein
MKPNKTWPVLTSYDSEHLRRIALPLTGVGDVDLKPARAVGAGKTLTVTVKG